MVEREIQEARVRIVLRVPAEFGGERVQVLADWNEWSHETSAMERVNGEYVTTVALAPGRVYRFRYLVDGEHWKNDPGADDYHPNAFGGYDSVIDLTSDGS